MVLGVIEVRIVEDERIASLYSVNTNDSATNLLMTNRVDRETYIEERFTLFPSLGSFSP